MTAPASGPHFAVIGGGISGLAAAERLLEGADRSLEGAGRPRGGGERPRVTLLEASDRLGGVIRTEEIAGRPVDLGPDSLVTRVPALHDTVQRLGLAQELIEPASGTTMVWSRGRLRPLPLGITTGMPDGIGPLIRSGLLSPKGIARAGLDLALPRTDPAEVGDSLGALIRRRFGDEVLEQVVDPLLGGIHHRSSDDLSLQMVTPQFASASSSHRSLLRGLRAQARQARGGAIAAAAMFTAPRGGIEELTRALQSRLGELGAEIRTGAAVRRVGPDRAVLESGEEIPADALVVALRPDAAAGVLSEAAPVAARGLAEIPQASAALVVLVYDRGTDETLPRGNGMLVPRREGGLVRAASWVTRKWPQRGGDGRAVVRCSIPLEDLDPALTDSEVADLVHRDLETRVGPLPAPTEHRVEPLANGLAVHRPGHLDRIASIEESLAAEAPAIRLAGPHISGSSLGACIAAAQRAADSALLATA